MLGFNPPVNSNPFAFLDLAFKFAQVLVQKCLEYMNESCLFVLMSVVYDYTTYEGDANISRMAIGLLCTIANYIPTLRSSDEKILELWLGVFNRLKKIGCDKRAEIRRNLFTVLESIINENIEVLPSNIWDYILYKLFTHILQHAETKYLESVAVNKGTQATITTSTNTVTPSFNALPLDPPVHRKNRFDEEGLRKEREETMRRYAEKEWEESVVTTLSVFAQVFIKYNDASFNESPVHEKTWSILLETYVRLIRCGTYSIVHEILKSIQKLSYSFHNTIENRLEEIWNIFKEFTNWLRVDYQLKTYKQRPIGSKLSSTVVDALEAISKAIRHSFEPRMIEEICQLLSTVCLILI